MDYLNIIYKAQVAKKYTDVKLILTDHDDSIIIYAHQIVLGLASGYFSELFDRNDLVLTSDKDASTSHDQNEINTSEDKNMQKHIPSITIGVQNAKVARDVILTCYGQKVNSTDLPDWHYLLETFNCRLFFRLKNDISWLYDIKVPSEGFARLYSIANKVEYSNDKKLMMTLAQNIPPDYDLENLSLRVIRQLIALTKYSIISLNSDNVITKWDSTTGDVLMTFGPCYLYIYRRLTLSPDCRIIAYISSSGYLHIHEIATFRKLKVLITCPDGTIVFSPDSSKIAVYWNYQGGISLWNANTNYSLIQLDGHINRVNGIAFSPDNLKIVSVSNDSIIRLWDANTGIQLTQFNVECPLFSVVFSQDGLKIIFGSATYNIRILDIETGNSHTLVVNPNVISCMAVSSCNLRIVSGDFSGNVCIWDMKPDGPLMTFQGHTSAIKSVAFSPDNMAIVSMDEGGIIKVWDIYSGKLLTTCKGSTNDASNFLFDKLFGAMDPELESKIKSLRL